MDERDAVARASEETRLPDATRRPPRRQCAVMQKRVPAVLLPALVVLLAAARGTRAAPPPSQPPSPPPPPPLEAAPLAMHLGAVSASEENQDAPLESQQGILVLDKAAPPHELGPNEPNEPLRAVKASVWGRAPLEAVVPGLAAVGPSTHGSRRLPRYRTRKVLPQQPLLDRQRKLKVLRRPDALARPAEQPDVYVVDETVTGYVAESPSYGEGELGDLHPEHGVAGGFLPFSPFAPYAPFSPFALPPLHGALGPDAALLAGAWIEEDDALQVRHRLQKLDFYFSLLRILSEDCRQRVLCETAREPERFSPLSAVLGEVTSFTGSYQYVTSHLINTTEGARLLSYMEASFRGQDRARSCAVFQYRCPSRTEDMINYDALCLWREMVRWLTIHVVARPP